MDRIKLLIGGLATVTALALASPGFAAPKKCDAALLEAFVDGISVPGTTPANDASCAKIKGNNGWGNGDQPAPGNSLLNNNAENYCPDGRCIELDVNGVVIANNPDGANDGYHVGSPSNSPASN